MNEIPYILKNAHFIPLLRKSSPFTQFNLKFYDAVMNHKIIYWNTNYKYEEIMDFATNLIIFQEENEKIIDYIEKNNYNL